MKSGKSIDWWEKNAKQGDVFRISVHDGSNNDWNFGMRKTPKSPREAVDVVFDRIYYPHDDIKEYVSPMPTFQKTKITLGDKSKEFPLDLEDLSQIYTKNGEKVARTYHREGGDVIEKSNRGRSPQENLGFEVQEIDGRFCCPCFSPENPKKFSYSQKGHAIWNHKKHIGMRN